MLNLKLTSLALVGLISRCSSRLGATSRHYTMGETRSVKYLSQAEAIGLDKELFEDYAFSVDQLMELAGLSVATVIAKLYPLPNYDRPIICCGPGNNGGDGLVCARHLKLFGYNPLVICPKPGRTQLYKNLLVQCEKFGITVQDTVPNQQERFNELGNLIVDSVFGFSFVPPNRNRQLAQLLNMMHSAGKMIVSVDVPSGWDVEHGPAKMIELQADMESDLKIPALNPNCLVSLTAPKLCAKALQGGYHYLGGRFCPESIQEKYKLNLPIYPGEDCIVRL